MSTMYDVFLDEMRRGLDDKKLKFPPLLDPSEDNDSIAEDKIKVS